MNPFHVTKVIRPRLDGARNALVLAAALALSLTAGIAQARINLTNLGVNTGIQLGTFDPTNPPTPPSGGGGGPGTVKDLQKLGYTCEPGHLAATECRACSLEPVSDTFTCALYLCSRADSCNVSRFRWDIPREVDVANLRMWAVEFAFGASSYFIADFNGDGLRDLGARVGGAVKVALSRGTYFEPQAGVFTGPFTVESQALPASLDVNHDGLRDVMNVNDDGFLTAGISAGAGLASTVTIPETWCEQLGDCLIGDVDGDGSPDVIEIMRGAVAGHRTGDVWVSKGHEAPGFPPLPPPPAVRDTDGDGIPDGVDNCIETENPTQKDTDNDGFGNACDPDLNNDGIVDAADLAIYTDCFGAAVRRRPACATSDFDDNGKVNTADSAVITDAFGGVPGPSAAHIAPRIELVAPLDGTILPVGTTKAWVAGYVPDAPAAGLKVTVDGVPVAVSGPSNLFQAFVDVPVPSATKMFRPIVIEVTRGSLKTVERRAVVIGDRTRHGGRSHLAAGARLSSSGLDRLEQFVRENTIPEKVADLVKSMNVYHPDSDCAAWGLGGPQFCWSGYTVSNAAIQTPTVTVDFLNNTLHVHILIPRLEFDWTLDSDGKDCGDHATATNLNADLLYGIGVSNGRVEVSELQEPIVTGEHFDVSGCAGLGGGRVEDGIISGLAGALNDPDDYQGNHQPFQKSPIGGAIEKIFAKLAKTGTVALTEPKLPVVKAAVRTRVKGVTPFDEPPVLVSYDTRFDAATLDGTGLAAWMAVGIDPTAPVAGLGTPSGAYQLPASFTGPVRTTPPAFPDAQPNGGAYNLAVAVTPNGLNEFLEAVTQTGLLAKQAETVSTITFGDPPNQTTIPITAGLLKGAGISAFGAYPDDEPISARITPPTFAPIVSGRRGPANESVDLHVPQVRIELIDSHQRVAVGLRADFRVGVNVGLGSATNGSGTLVATAQGLQLLDFAMVENPINADPAQVFQRILCVNKPADDLLPCALGGKLEKGLNLVLKKIDLPSLADDDPTTADVTLAPQCIQTMSNGMLVATFGLRIPSDPPPSKISTVVGNAICIAPLATTGFTSTGTGGTKTGTVGTVGTVGTFQMTPTR